jgi:hypothetical protein
MGRDVLAVNQTCAHLRQRVKDLQKKELDSLPKTVERAVIQEQLAAARRKLQQHILK